MDLKVCVGSSCHLKGSYQVIKTFEKLIDENDLKEKLSLKACFCTGNCMQGISVMCGDTPVQNVNFSNCKEIFNEKILPLLD